jgi:hypothetical protein
VRMISLDGLSPYSYQVFPDWVSLIFFEFLVILIELSIFCIIGALYFRKRKLESSKAKTVFISEQESEERASDTAFAIGFYAIIIGNIVTAIIGYWLYISFLG